MRGSMRAETKQRDVIRVGQRRAQYLALDRDQPSRIYKLVIHLALSDPNIRV